MDFTEVSTSSHVRGSKRHAPAGSPSIPCASTWTSSGCRAPADGVGRIVVRYPSGAVCHSRTRSPRTRTVARAGRPGGAHSRILRRCARTAASGCESSVVSPPSFIRLPSLSSRHSTGSAVVSIGRPRRAASSSPRIDVLVCLLRAERGLSPVATVSGPLSNGCYWSLPSRSSTPWCLRQPGHVPQLRWPVWQEWVQPRTASVTPEARISSSLVIPAAGALTRTAPSCMTSSASSFS